VGAESTRYHETASGRETLAADSVVITSTGLADPLGGRPIDARLHGCAGAFALRQPFGHWPLELSIVLPEAASTSCSATGGKGVLE